jgi:hypothetical protein
VYAHLLEKLGVSNIEERWCDKIFMNTVMYMYKVSFYIHPNLLFVQETAQAFLIHCPYQSQGEKENV